MAEILAAQFDFVKLGVEEERKRCAKCGKALPPLERYKTETQCLGCKNKAREATEAVPRVLPRRKRLERISELPSKSRPTPKLKGEVRLSENVQTAVVKKPKRRRVENTRFDRFLASLAKKSRP